MRLLASTVLVDRYACHVLPPAPTACASAWQCASAPAKPPRLPPLPGFALVTKKLMFPAGACASATPTPRANTASPPNTWIPFILNPPFMRKSECRNRKNVANAADEVNSAFLSFATKRGCGNDHREDRVVLPGLDDARNGLAMALRLIVERHLMRDHEIEHREHC